MREVTLLLKLEQIEAGNRNSLLNALRDVGEFDSDFNGENGIDYLWEDVNGFESNMEYLISEVKDISDDEECITTYIDTWMDNDRNYYNEYELDFIKDKNNNVTAFAFSVIYGY